MKVIIKVDSTPEIEEIRQAISPLGTHTLRFSISDGGIKLKVNAGVWSPPLGEVEVDN